VRRRTLLTGLAGFAGGLTAARTTPALAHGPRRVLHVRPGGSVQAAVDAVTGPGWTIVVHPGTYREVVNIAAESIGAPKPMFFLNGGLDPLFPADGVRVAHDKLRAVWRSRHAEERLRLKTWPDLGHVFTAPLQDEVFDWLGSVL
jgi:hypothetical protein